MSAHQRPWGKLSQEAKLESVRALEESGQAPSTIAFRLSAPRAEVDRICSLIRRQRHAVPDEATEDSVADEAAEKPAPPPVAIVEPEPQEQEAEDEVSAPVEVATLDQEPAVTAPEVPAKPIEPIPFFDAVDETPRSWSVMGPAERREAVVDLFKKERSYAEIASELGCERSHVAGVLNRARASGVQLPDTRGRNPKRKGTKAKPIPTARPKAAAKPPKPEPVPKPTTPAIIQPEPPKPDVVTISRAQAFEPLPDTTPISLLQLTERTCKWPVNGLYGREDLFCGAPCDFDPKKPYCGAHEALVADRRGKHGPHPGR